MHLQPVFSSCRFVGPGRSNRLFDLGLCLPSASSLTEKDVERVCATLSRR